MASIMKVLLLLLLLDAPPAGAEKEEAAGAPDIPGLWKLQMKELKGKGEIRRREIKIRTNDKLNCSHFRLTNERKYILN